MFTATHVTNDGPPLDAGGRVCIVESLIDLRS